MAIVYLETLPALKKAISAKTTKNVYVMPRVGILTLWVRVTKAEALSMLAEIAPDATPSDCEMGTGAFGTINEYGEVYIG